MLNQVFRKSTLILACSVQMTRGTGISLSMMKPSHPELPFYAGLLKIHGKNIVSIPPEPIYVIGTEVPVPGGAQEEEDIIIPTKPEDAARTIEITRQCFYDTGTFRGVGTGCGRGGTAGGGIWR